MFEITRYESIGSLVDEIVYHLLEREAKLERVKLSSKDDGKGGFFFRSKEDQDPEYLAVLIHGSGVVRAGQWARRIIMNDQLRAGTQV